MIKPCIVQIMLYQFLYATWQYSNRSAVLRYTHLSSPAWLIATIICFTCSYFLWILQSRVNRNSLVCSIRNIIQGTHHRRRRRPPPPNFCRCKNLGKFRGKFGQIRANFEQIRAKIKAKGAHFVNFFCSSIIFYRDNLYHEPWIITLPKAWTLSWRGLCCVKCCWCSSDVLWWPYYIYTVC